MNPDATAVGALAMAVVALAGTVTACVKLMKDMGTMTKQLKDLQTQGLSGPSDCGTDTNPGTGAGCTPLRALEERVEQQHKDMKADLQEVKTDVKQILWHMVNGHGPG